MKEIWYSCGRWPVTMKNITWIVVFVLFVASPVFGQETCLSAEEKKLYDLINQYRKTKKLKPIPLSSKLTKTAQAHVRDLNENYAYEDGAKCNPHSWSDKGKWSSCCYTPDHKEAKCMWDKPMEIAGYASAGYEIAYYTSGEASAEEGLAGWKKSPGHNPVIVNLGTWEKIEWKAIGIGMNGNYGVVWFGELAHEETPVVCK